ncbi:alpha/beta fold hydrolase [Leptolyngbya sp. 7M]|uniref:alpha/beta fold hydrolase n=1 Tax=Leptolyngbya sp. 7M TaxID=2812896 RepID=UPI001B8D20E9|nr:alpha/beta fold hydrolase [Leptolyngbya sp. 7M]QYO66536.1 alpha/beta fold hydrolase [Leptolyngbya sp. 7M]
MKKTSFSSLPLALLLLIFVVSSAVAQSLTVRQIMAEPSIAGQRVSGEKLSPDGTKVIFLWNAEGQPKRDLYLVSTSGGAREKILSSSQLPEPQRPPERPNPLNYGVDMRDQFVRDRENQLGNFEWSPDSKRLVFTHSGDIFLMTLADRSIKRYTQTQAPEFGARFLDNDRIIFSQGGNAFVLNISDATITQITHEANQQQFISIGNVATSKNGKMAAYVVTDSSKQRQLIVPNFLPEYVTGGGPRRGWSEQRLMFMPTDGSRQAPHEIKLPKHEGVSSFRRMVWASDDRSLIVDRLDKDTKRRQLFYIYNVGAKDEKIILITEETDDKWQAPLSTIFEPHPNNPAQLFFGSERDGYNHLYLATLQAEIRSSGSVTNENDRVAEGSPGFTSNVKIEQLTKGSWQVEWARWMTDGQIVYISTENSYLEREFYTVDPRNASRVKLATHGVGMKGSPQLSDSGEQVLIYDYSRWNQPSDLYAVKLCKGCDFTSNTSQLTETVPKTFSERTWTVPQFIEITSRDGKRIPAKIYLPPGHNKNSRTKYPMAIFVHGAGYLQNVINGWNNYYREFMFNDMLAKKGYVVLDIDYRGSAGYGRDWRTDVYDFLGGKDFDDHIDSIDHMVKNYAVDQKRIGVYGGSYGGFMAGMLVMRAPERIAAAAALRSVFDWKNYYAANPFYTAQRLGFPDKNPEAYKRSSPIAYADKLERPLLILHGMVDDNVHVQDSIQLIEKLIRLQKTQYFEAMLYPSENHAFVRPESWADEYERILWFFEKHLAVK